MNYKIVGRREGDIEQIWANPEKANKVLGWTARRQSRIQWLRHGDGNNGCVKEV